MRRGVKPFASATFGSAPCAKRASTALVWPCRVAIIRAVRPSASRALTSTCESSAACTACVSPDSAARHNGSGEAVLVDTATGFAAAAAAGGATGVGVGATAAV